MVAAATNEVGPALRVAGAAVVCLLLAEWWHLEYASLAVLTAHMVLAQYAFTAFQKGVERLAGRGLGIVLGLVIVTLFPNAPLVGVLVKALALLAFFYVHFSGRLAYTFLNAGLYLAMIVEVGRLEPGRAVAEGKELFLAVLIGVIVADAVVWLTGSERNLHIETSGQPLFPIGGDRLAHSAMLVAIVLLTQTFTRWLSLPTGASLISVMMLNIAPDLHALLRKGELRLAGAFLAAAWGGLAFLLLGRLPHLGLLVALLFAGMFVAAYLTRTLGANSYAGLQMGLVLPLVLIVPPSEFGTFTGFTQRLEGIVAALAASLLVGGVWASFGWGMAVEESEPRPGPTAPAAGPSRAR